MSWTASSSRIEPCSIDVTPARTAALIPAVPCAWAATRRCSSVAASTTARISSSLYCCKPAESVSDSTPPVAQILITSAPYFTTYRTALRTSSTPLATPSSMPIPASGPSRPGRSPSVASQAAPDAEGDAGAHDARARHPARVDGVAEGDVTELGRAHDAHGREPRLERLLRVRSAEQRELGRGLHQAGVVPVAVAAGVPHAVDVGVDEAGKHGVAREIDHRRAARTRHVR